MDDPRLTRGMAAKGRKEIGLALLDLVDDINDGRVDAREMFFSPAKPAGQRTASAQENWVVTIKGKGTGIPCEAPDAEPVEEFTGALF